MKIFRRTERYCRLCGKRYMPKGPTFKDGTCKPAHKQVLYRALKKYRDRLKIRSGRVRNARSK